MIASLRRMATAGLVAGLALVQAAPAAAQASAAAGNPPAAGIAAGTGAAAGHVGPSGAASMAQAGLGLFAVIALILLLAWLARRAGLVRHGQGGTMKVVGSTALGPRQRLVMVEVGDTCLVLGVSAGEIRTLHTLPAQAARAPGQSPDPERGGPANPAGSGSFGQKLLRAMQHNLKS
ncbi:flagellar biosynthetic protein FliO [Cupriavidus basilensis]|uniref:flagellar biosynthetic protein FliO n=1 Tax=Cupriavidus basilensis TaxID=68895 RepID=UPI000750EE04|nr:flagellar biosynthetic protein FliO [Cupriavidus basilensis]